MTYGCEGSLQEVTHRGRRTLGLRVAILDTRELEQTLRRRRRNESGTSGSGDETAHDGTDLSRDLRGYSVGLTEVGTPVTPTDRNDGELSEDDGATDGSRDFLRALYTETDVAVEVADRNERLEARALTSTGLLLDGHDLHDLIFELGEEEIDDLVLLDGKREEVDLLHGLDLAVLHETAELSDGDPGGRPCIGRCDTGFADEQKLTTPSPRPCDHHGGDRDGPVHGHHAHARNRRVRVQSQP